MRGFLGEVDQFQARGWPYDPDAPTGHVAVQLNLGHRMLGQVVASIHRPDLEQAGVGAGDHGFILNYQTPLDAADVDRVEAFALQSDGKMFPLPRSLSALSRDTEASDPVLTFSGAMSDEAQYPIFILGAARSGTSAMTLALLKTGSFRGTEEGHLLDLLAHWRVRLREFYNLKWDDAQPGRNTMIARVPIEYFSAHLNRIFMETIRQLFGEGRWIEKTPNSNAIHLAPCFKQIWPHSRFIFMKRRGLENLASRLRKFPGVDFDEHCREWASAMQAWLAVRDSLSGSAIEIDQRYLALHQLDAAVRLCEFLDLNGAESRVVKESFSHDFPQRTANDIAVPADRSTLDWTPEQREIFDRQCRPMMDAFGYTDDTTYNKEGILRSGFRYL
jgi:hypothetical protein